MIYVVAPSEGGIHDLLAKQATIEGQLQPKTSVSHRTVSLSIN
jgi:hypothetical protein